MKLLRFRGRERVLAALFGALAIAGVAFLVFFSGGPSGPSRHGPVPPAAVTGAVAYRDKPVSSGGYNTFAGAFVDPRDGAIGTAYANVSGTAPPRCVRPGEPQGCDDRGFRGTTTRFAIRESRDLGQTFAAPIPDETMPSPPPHAYTGQPTIALRFDDNGTRAGTLLRRINGEDVGIYDPATGLAQTAFLQRLEPGSTRWTGRQILLDPARYTCNLTRISRLRDGKTLVATGAFWNVPAGRRLKTPVTEIPSWLLMVSTDEGTTWHSAMSAPANIHDVAPANEWDVAELENGDLLAVMRTRDGATTVRKQAILHRTGDEITTTTGATSAGGWTMDEPRLTGFPQVLTPQHPELLSIEHGPGAGGILHIADEGIEYTADAGRTWAKVKFPSDWTPHYYPISIQGTGNNIYVFSHARGDEAYTTGVDKPVFADLVRLAVDRDAGAGG